MTQNTTRLETARWEDRMITQEERQEIIDTAVEKALLSLPAVMGNLMAQQAAYSKINTQFYKDYPDFASHKDVVRAIVEKVDGENPLLTYDEKLKKAAPLIMESIRVTKGLDVTTIKADLNRTYAGSESLTAQRPDSLGDL